MKTGKRFLLGFLFIVATYAFAQHIGVITHFNGALGVRMPVLTYQEPSGVSGPPQFTVDAPDVGVPNFTVSTSEQKDAKKALKALEGVEEADRMALGYSRDQFGSGWATKDGCDTRNVVLARDLSNVTYAPGSTCTVAAGTLSDPYTGKTIEFVRGPSTSTAVQIDHIVPVAAAWRLGAHKWSRTERVAFYNDTDNLLAVDGPANNTKSDKTLAEFSTATTKDGSPLIQQSSICRITTTYVNVTVKYDLQMTKEDLSYASRTLKDCAK